MIQKGILNPHLLHLLARIRHTNRLVIADWAFPFWPQIETVDISLSKGIPTVLDVLNNLQPNFKIGRIWQAQEFVSHNSPAILEQFDDTFSLFREATVERLPHLDFKALVPGSIGLIRTGDPTPYGNIIVESV